LGRGARRREVCSEHLTCTIGPDQGPERIKGMSMEYLGMIAAKPVVTLASMAATDFGDWLCKFIGICA
jgi:hypothetical protein